MQDSQTKESATSVSRAGMLMRFPEHISTTLQPLDWNIIRKVYGHLEREMEGKVTFSLNKQQKTMLTVV